MKLDLNIYIFLIGLAILLAGLVFLALDQTKYSLFVVTLTGVGGSILATGLTNWLITRQYVGVDVTSIVQALTSNSRFIRRNQSLEIIFNLKDNDQVFVTGEHKFTLFNEGTRRDIKRFELYTDLGSWNNSGGFKAVMKPSGTLLQNEQLEKFLRRKNGKIYYKDEVHINPNSSGNFLFKTFGSYRRIDRLIWTVQDISTDFTIKIVNNTGVKNAFIIKVNHHKEKEILNSQITINETGDCNEVIILNFNCDVLPYQGFEVMWDLDSPQEEKEESLSQSLQPMHV